MLINTLIKNFDAFGLSWSDWAEPERKYCDAVAANRDPLQNKNIIAAITPRILGHIYNWSGQYGNSYQIQVGKLYHEYYLIKVLSTFGLSYIARPLAAKAIDTAIDLDQYSIIYDVARILSRYASFGGDPALTDRYDEIALMAYESIGYEMQMESLYNRTIAKMRDRQGLAHDDISSISDLIDSIEDRCTDEDSITPRYIYMRYKLLYILHMYHSDPVSALSMCTHGYEFFADLHYRHDEACMDFANCAIDCLQLANRYDDADTWIKRASKYVKSGSTNYFNLKELQLRCYISHRQPGQALKIYKELSQSPEYLKIMPAYLQERLYIYRIHIAIIDREPIKIERYINDIMDLSNDKYAMNIAIIVAHLSYLYHMRLYTDLLDHETRIRTYMSRYVESTRDRAMINYIFLQAKKAYITGYDRKIADIVHELQNTEPSAHELINYNELITIL